MSAGDFVQERASMLILVESYSLKMTNIENVIIKYMRRVRSVSEVENCSTKIIQPRWAIEE